MAMNRISHKLTCTKCGRELDFAVSYYFVGMDRYCSRCYFEVYPAYSLPPALPDTVVPSAVNRLVESAELIGYMSAALESALPLMKSQRGKDGIQKALDAYRSWLNKQR